MSNPLEPTSPAMSGLPSPSPEVVSSAIGGLEEAASLLARGIFRSRPPKGADRLTLTRSPQHPPLLLPHLRRLVQLLQREAVGFGAVQD